MRAWVTPALIRYFADQKNSADDVICPDRPSADHEWIDGQGWIVPADSADRRASIEIDGLNRLLFEVLWRHENRLRVLEGLQPITRLVFKQALIDAWKTLNP